MSEEKLPGEEKTISDHVEGTDSAPSAGLEREDAQPSGPIATPTRRGMWSDGSPDTSGYGGIVRTYLPRQASDRPLQDAEERVVAARVKPVDSPGQKRDSLAAARESGAVRHPVDAIGGARDNRETAIDKPRRSLHSDVLAVARGGPRAHECDRVAEGFERRIVAAHP